MMRLLPLLPLLPLLSCSPEAPGPRPQALVYIDTDALVPRMANRLRVTVLDANLAPRCSACVREVALDAATSFPLSFGVAPASDGGPTFLRATLFLAGRTTGGVPRAEIAVDRIAEVRTAGGVIAQDLFLAFDCAGIPPDTAARTTCISRDEPAGALAPLPAHVEAPSRISTFRAEVAHECGEPPPASKDRFGGEVCIPGGVFWFGDHRKQGFGPTFDAVPERAVAVRPFFMDTHEYSVARYRAAVRAGYRSGDPPITSCYDGSTTESSCTRCNLYGVGAADPDGDAHPLNCVSAATAEALCKREGKRLPSEVEWEWAGGGREEERLFPWGNDEPTPCAKVEDAATGGCFPGDWGQTQTLLGARWGSPRLDAIPYDVTVDGLFGMGEGVYEWLADTFQPLSGPCWAPGSYDTSPICTSSITTPLRRSTRSYHYSIRGSGAFAITNRASLPPASKATAIGFRCVRDVPE